MQGGRLESRGDGQDEPMTIVFQYKKVRGVRVFGAADLLEDLIQGSS